MSADERGWLESAARAVADGTPVEWPPQGADAGPDAELLRCMRVISGIAAASRESSGEEGRTPAAGRPDLEAPDKWGPLVLGPLLGRGSFGDVYRAFDPRLGREVALKLLRGGLSGDRGPGGADVIEEGRLLARVRHPNVAVVYGADEIEGRVGVWMELVDGRTLEDELKARGRFDPREAAAIGIEVCRALDAVHAAGVIHRDVKAHNVMRDRSGRIVLTDFGTGCDQDADTGHVTGTVPYLAPELFRGDAATPQSDLYSVGVLLFHLLTGSYPVPGATVGDVRDAHASGTRVPLAAARPGLPRALVAVVDRALSPDSDSRFQTSADMGAALQRFLLVSRTPRRRLASYASLALFALVLAAALLFARPGTLGGGNATTARPGAASAGAGVTTRSPEARRLYERAVALFESPSDEAPEAEALLRQAIAADPGFASAHIMLAFALDNQNKPLEAILPVIARSRELEHHASEAERLFIEGSAELLTSHVEAAIASYDALLRIEPTHYWAVNNTAICYRRAGRQDDALPYFAKAADLRPGVVDAQVTAAERLCEAGRFADAQPYASRAQRLVAAGHGCDSPSRRWLAFYPVFERWRAGDIDGAEAELARAIALHRGELWESGKGGENMLSEFAGDWYMTLGRLRQAKAVYATAPIDPDVGGVYQAFWAQAADDPPLFRRGILQWYSSVGPRKMNWWTSGMLARAGWIREARRSLDAFEARVRTEGTTDMPLAQALERYMHGEIAAATGDSRVAYEDFDFALRRVPYSWKFAPLAAITAVLEQRHAPEGAITLLEQLLPRRAIYANDKVWGAVWLQLESRLADLYRETGHDQDAEAIESGLRLLLARADPDHPILRHLDRVDSAR